MTANEFINACIKLGAKADGQIVFVRDENCVLDFCVQEKVGGSLLTFIHHQMKADQKNFYSFIQDVVTRGLGDKLLFVERPNGKCKDVGACIIKEFMQGNIFVALD